jgi:hypothetical protein
MTVPAIICHKVPVIGIIYPDILGHIIHDWVGWSVDFALG